MIIKLNSNKLITGFIIFLFNLILTSFYFYCFIGNLNAYELWEEATYSGITSTYFLFDVLQYQLYPDQHNFNDIITIFSNGSTMIHTAILQLIFGGGEGLGTSIIVNSIFIAILISKITINRNKSLIIYAILAPYFIFYSIGWTKEILLTLSLFLYLKNIDLRLNLNLGVSFILCLLTRPQFFPILIIVNYIKKIREFYFYTTILVLLALAPILLLLVPEVYHSASIHFYEQSGGQGYSVYTDYLKNNIPFLSIIGYIFSLIKIYYEPLSSVIHEINMYAIVEIYLQLIFLLVIYRSNFSIFNNRASKYIFIIINLMVCSLPFTHFRYLLPILVTIILINYKYLFLDNE